jgi:hypothetical protein
MAGSENVRHLKDADDMWIITYKNQGDQASVMGMELKSYYCDDTLKALKSLNTMETSV